MRIYVSDQGFTSASTALVGGNLLAVDVVLDLAGRLSEYAGMAGSDSTATDFATSYDEAARASVTGLQSLVEAFAALARLVEASLANHAHAEERSSIAGRVPAPTGVANDAVGVYVSAPASALGADSSGPGGMPGVVLDMLQDVFWPNADTDRVRRAASTWTAASESVGLLTGHLDSAAGELAAERSPEVPIVLDVLDDLRSRVDGLATQLASLGAACAEYADHVEEKRSELLSLLEELAVEIGVTAVVGGIASVISGGLAGAAASGVGAARLAAAGSRARGILDGLRVLTAGSALRAEPVVASAGEVASVSGRISRARVLLMDASEVGSGRSLSAGQFGRGFLQRHENDIAHTIREHVGKSVSQLEKRLVEKPRLRRASTFRTQEEAEAAVERAFTARQPEIEKWLSSPTRSKGFSADLGYDVGQVLIKSTRELLSTTKVRIVLIPDETMPAGWRLLTAYPEL